MRRMKTFLGILCLTTSFASAESLLLLPITGDVGKAEDIATVNQLYRDVVEGRFKGTVLPVPLASEPCGARDCAVKAAQISQADQVIYSTFSRLGTKWVFNSTIVKADGSNAFNQRLTALSLEDMEPVTQRMADALLNRKSAELVATVDNLTEKEETQQPQRRRSLYSTGVRVGYLFPSGKNSFSYEKSDQYFYGGYYDPNSPYYWIDTSRYVPQDPQTFPQIIRLAWMNNWQFRNNLLLNTDLVWGVGNDFFTDIGVDANLDYLFNPSALFPFDYAPFLGGGLGLHYLHPDENTSLGGTKRNSGVTLTAQGGLLLFRTYDVNVMLRGYYQVVVNTDVDKGAGVDVGITYRNSEAAKNRSSSGGGFFSTLGKICLVGCLGYLAIVAIVVSSNPNI